ncbi:MAG: hypothetical protein JW838_10695 [Spirochaetes bacterium]|nr:hypothetical protein [Spirochaetota bacterium]
MARFLTACIIVLVAATCGESLAQERDLVYTFIGPVAGGGFQHVTTRDWRNVYQKQSSAGNYYHGGCSIWVISRWLIGDFSVQYANNRYERPLQHLYFTISGKAAFTVKRIVTFAPGIGFYFELPPSNRGFRGGAGVRTPLAILFHTTFDTRLFIEGSFMYGWLGMGDRSTKLSYGANLGFIFKVGRI